MSAYYDIQNNQNKMNTEKNKLKVNVHLKFNTKMYTYKK